MVQQKFFEIFWKGNIAPEDVITKITAGSLFRTPDSEAWIEKKWQQELLRSDFKPWPNDTKPTRFRFCGVEEKEGKLTVTLDPCVSYRDFIGSNSPQFVEQFGEASNPHPLAVSAVIVAHDADGPKIMLTVRENVDYKPGGYHASIGGFIDTRKEKDVVAAIYREIKEESGIERLELDDLRCVVVAYNPWSLHSDLVFLATTKLPSEDIRKRKRDDENSHFYFIPATRQSIEELITKTSHANVIIAMVGLLLLGKHLPVKADENEQPEEWYKRMLAFLAEESQDYDSAEVRAKLEARDIARFQEMIKQS